MTEDEKRSIIRLSFKLDELLTELEAFKVNSMTFKEIKRISSQLKYNDLTIPELHYVLHYNDDADELDQKMALDRVDDLCYRSEKNSAEWFALEAKLKTTLKNNKYSDDEDGRDHLKADRKDIARLHQRMWKLRDYLPESNCP